MRKVLPVLLVLIACLFIINLTSQEFTYVGAAKCKMCHKSEKQGQQYSIWETSKHSKSFSALTSDAAKAQTPDAPENAECLKCHALLFDKNPDLKEEGVTCEVCHGPGSAYKKMSIMKDHAESMKNGMIEYNSVEAIKNHCSSCHENAHDKPFDFEERWAKIKHPRPKKN